MALGVAACTVGKVRVSTVFMCVCSTFRPSDFLLFVKNGFVVGVRCQGNSESLKECEYPHCASATRRLALDNRTYSAQLANSTHTRCRPTLSWMGGAVAEWLERREVGEGGREGGEGGREVWESRVFVKDGLSRDHGLHSRDHLPSPNHSAPHNPGFDCD